MHNWRANLGRIYVNLEAHHFKLRDFPAFLVLVGIEERMMLRMFPKSNQMLLNAW